MLLALLLGEPSAKKSRVGDTEFLCDAYAVVSVEDGVGVRADFDRDLYPTGSDVILQQLVLVRT